MAGYMPIHYTTVTTVQHVYLSLRFQIQFKNIKIVIIIEYTVIGQKLKKVSLYTSQTVKLPCGTTSNRG
jgi:hypothetical protein